MPTPAATTMFVNFRVPATAVLINWLIKHTLLVVRRKRNVHPQDCQMNLKTAGGGPSVAVIAS